MPPLSFPTVRAAARPPHSRKRSTHAPLTDGIVTVRTQQCARANDIRLSATHGIDEVMKSQNLDAILFPGPSGASIAARPGYPTVIVPWAMVPNEPTTKFPEGFKALPQPYGVSFTGMACSEPTLLKLAYAFEQATKKRVPPASTP
jgi:amidase